MVVAHLLVVDDSRGERKRVQIKLRDLARLQRPEFAENLRDLAPHVGSQVAGIGPRVAQELCLIERLRRLEGPVGRHPVPPVHVALELGQIIELGWLDPVGLSLNASDGEGMPDDAVEDHPGIVFPREAVAHKLERDLAVACQKLPEGLRLERANLIVSSHDHREYRGLDPTDAPEKILSAVADGVIASGVKAHDPVGLAPAAGRCVKSVVVGQRPQAGEGVSDSGLGQGAEPEPPGWLSLAPGELQDVAEDELSFSAGVCGADQLVCGSKETLDGRKLLSCPALANGFELESLGDDGERGEGPRLQRLVVVLRLLQGRKMTQGPGDLIPPALEIPIVSPCGAKKRGEFAGDRWFLGEHDSHGSSLSAAQTIRSPGESGQFVLTPGCRCQLSGRLAHLARELPTESRTYSGILPYTY